MAEDTATMIDVEDINGKPIRLFSTTGKPATVTQFGKALSTYNSTLKSGSPNAGEGFIALPPGGMSTLRSGFEAVTQPIRTAVPQATEALGGIAATSPLLMLGARAGMIPGSVAEALITAGRTVGRTTGELAVEPIKTPRNLGVTVGTGVAAPFLGPITGATGAVRALPLIGNMAKSALAGAGGAELAAVGTGEPFDPGKAVEELAIGALSGGLTSTIGYILTKFMPSQGTKIADDIVKELTKAYPGIADDPGGKLIHMVGPRQIERIAQRMSTGLQGELDDVTTALMNNIKNTLPSGKLQLSVGQQATLRAHTRHIVDAHTKMLDAVGNPEALAKSDQAAAAAKQGLLDFFRGNTATGVKPAYPGIKSIEPTALRIESLIADYSDNLERFKNGMQVIDFMRQAGAHEQWNPMQFAQLIRGTYQDPSNTLLGRIGKILGGGRELTELPLPGQREPGSEGMRATLNMIKEFIPFLNKTPDLKYKGPGVPWQAPSTTPLSQLSTAQGRGTAPLQAMPTIAVQETGQAAMKHYMDKNK